MKSNHSQMAFLRAHVGQELFLGIWSDSDQVHGHRRWQIQGIRPNQTLKRKASLHSPEEWIMVIVRGGFGPATISAAQVVRASVEPWDGDEPFWREWDQGLSVQPNISQVIAGALEAQSG